MRKFERVTGPAIPFGRANVDTDAILPGRYLKTVSRRGLGRVAFEALRRDPANLFDQPRYRGAPILLAGENFGCGSSREHAPWALDDLGIRVVIAPSFADIFSANALNNGLLLVALDAGDVAGLLVQAPREAFTVDLVRQEIAVGGAVTPFAIEPFAKERLLRGLDEIDLTERHGDAITAFEAARDAACEWLAHVASRP